MKEILAQCKSAKNDSLERCKNICCYGSGYVKIYHPDPT